MTESEWLEVVKKVRGNWDGFCVDKQKFDTFLDALKEFDVRHVREAADRIIREYGYPPIVATFTVYIEQVQKDAQYKASREQAEKSRVGDVKREPAGDGGWLRFIRWKAENNIPNPRDTDEDKELKAKFEKEYLDWQPRKRREVKRGGMRRIGGSLGDAMGNLR